MLNMVFAVVSGLAVGSFLNVLAVRLPRGETLSGRSRCPRCRAPIPWYRYFPLFSFLLQRGRCASCRGKISWQYPLVELATAALFLLVASKHVVGGGSGVGAPAAIGNLLAVARDWFFVAVLVLVFVVDLRHYLILDAVTLPSAALAVAFNLISGKPWGTLLVGAILGAGFFAAQYVLSDGRWIGDGDIRLGLLLGVMLGWPSIAVALAVAYFSGAAVGVALLVAGVKRFGSRLPFGTFLSAGGVVALLYGEPVIRWYLTLLGY